MVERILVMIELGHKLTQQINRFLDLYERHVAAIERLENDDEVEEEMSEYEKKMMKDYLDNNWPERDE